MKNILLLFSMILILSSSAFSQKKVIGKYINEKSQITSSESSNFVFPIVLENGTENGDFRKIDIDTLVKIFEGGMDLNQGLKTEHGFAPPERPDSILFLNGTGLNVNGDIEAVRFFSDAANPLRFSRFDGVDGQFQTFYIDQNNNGKSTELHLVTDGNYDGSGWAYNSLKSTLVNQGNDLQKFANHGRGIMNFTSSILKAWTPGWNGAESLDSLRLVKQFSFRNSDGPGRVYLDIWHDLTKIYNHLQVEGETTLNNALTLTPISTLPTSPQEGQMTILINGGVNQLQVYLNGTWHIIAQ